MNGQQRADDALAAASLRRVAAHLRAEAAELPESLADLRSRYIETALDLAVEAGPGQLGALRAVPRQEVMG